MRISLLRATAEEMNVVHADSFSLPEQHTHAQRLIKFWSKSPFFLIVTSVLRNVPATGPLPALRYCTEVLEAKCPLSTHRAADASWHRVGYALGRRGAASGVGVHGRMGRLTLQSLIYASF